MQGSLTVVVNKEDYVENLQKGKRDMMVECDVFYTEIDSDMTSESLKIVLKLYEEGVILQDLKQNTYLDSQLMVGLKAI